MDMIMTQKTNSSNTKRIEDRFTAAVNVIRSLPKNGKYMFIQLNIMTTLSITKSLSNELFLSSFHKKCIVFIYNF